MKSGQLLSFIHTFPTNPDPLHRHHSVIRPTFDAIRLGLNLTGRKESIYPFILFTSFTHSRPRARPILAPTSWIC